MCGIQAIFWDQGNWLTSGSLPGIWRACKVFSVDTAAVAGGAGKAEVWYTVLALSDLAVSGSLP